MILYWLFDGCMKIYKTIHLYANTKPQIKRNILLCHFLHKKIQIYYAFSVFMPLKNLM